MKYFTLTKIRQQFISRLLATFSIASLILLPMQYLPLGLRRSADDADPLNLRAWFPDCAPYWWKDIVPKVLVATLVLTAVFSLLNLRLLRKNQKTAKAAAPAAAAMSAAGTSLRTAPSAV